MRSLLVVMVLAASAVAAPPQLAPATAGSLTVSLPKGWKVTSQSAGATIFVAQQDPAKADAAALLVTIQLAGNTQTEDQLLDVVAKQVATNVKVVKREAIAGGGHMLIADGTAGAIKVRIGAIAVASGGSGVMGVLVAKPGDFDALGGPGLVTSVMTSIRAQPAAQPAPAAPAPAASHGRITIPDLAGVWDSDEASIKQYAYSNGGGYAGATAMSSRKTYTVAANGDYTAKFANYAGGTAGGRGTFLWSNASGTWSFLPSGVLQMTSKGVATTYYTIVSFSTDGDVSTLLISSPHWDKADPPDPRCPCDKLFRKNPPRK
ncbi:MAG: hypothetical protein ACM31C_35160 [Acidobacteriota bacterium]